MQDTRNARCMHLSQGLLVLLVTATLVGLFAAGCTTQAAPDVSPGEKAGVAEEVTAAATVRAVDLDKRLVTLQREDGNVVTVVAGPTVRNLPQVAVGDTVTVRYIEAVLASLKKPGEPVTAPEVTVELARAEVGEKPGGVIAQHTSSTVTIESVDTVNNRVVFTAPDGRLRILTVRRPTFQEYIKGLKSGDKVEITYTEAVAISVEKSPPAKQ